MNKEELNQWMKEAKFITCAFCEFDGRGNKWETRIFEKDNRLYSIGFCNNHPNPKFGEHGHESERDESGKRKKDKNGEYIYIYEPTPVKKVTTTKTIKVTEYIEEEEK